MEMLFLGIIAVIVLYGISLGVKPIDKEEKACKLHRWAESEVDGHLHCLRCNKKPMNDEGEEV